MITLQEEGGGGLCLVWEEEAFLHVETNEVGFALYGKGAILAFSIPRGSYNLCPRGYVVVRLGYM